MLVKIPLLAFLVFGVTYPLFFWLTAKDPIKHNFHRFHLACPVVIAGLAIVGLWLLPPSLSVPDSLKHWAVVWLACALLITAFFWNKETVHVATITLLCLWGMKVFAAVYGHLVADNTTQILVALLSGLVVSAIFYAMNLGHFYLNVHGLKISHLKNATVAFGVLLLVRLVWNIGFMAFGKVLYGGQMEPVWHFMNSMDGFLLWMALFFGTLFPLAGLYFALGTLKLKNTQATTGILYVLLSAVLLGDLAFKYYLLKFGIPM